METRILGTGLAAALLASLAACGGSGGKDEAQMSTLRVTVTNLTASQPMSPLLVAVNKGAVGWQAGMSASQGLERLAEGGDGSVLAAELAAAGGIADASGSAAVAPGGSDSVELSYRSDAQATLTLATMLVNTNDAFTGLTGLPVGALAPGESLSRVLAAWDAGTEDNDEAAGTLPGPADGGEGFNPARSDALDAVRVHAGVVSHDDGLVTSVLGSKHRFDNPVLQVTIERVR